MPIIELPDRGIELEFPDDMAMDAIEAAIKAEFYPAAEPTLPEPTLMPSHAQDPTAEPDPGLTPPDPGGPGQSSKFEEFKDSFRPAAPQVPDLGIDTAPPELPAGSPIPGLAELIPELADMPPEIRAKHPFALGEIAVDYWGRFLMTPEDEAAMQAEYPNAMAARYAAASLLLPGVSEKFASPIEMEKFKNLSTQEQKEEIVGLAAGYAVFGAGAHGARALALSAVKTYPILSKSIGQLFQESNWLRRMTNRERGLVLQTIDDMARAGASEARILREMKNRGLEKEAYERFARSQGIDPEAVEPFDVTIGAQTPESPAVASGSLLEPIKKGLPEPPAKRIFEPKEEPSGPTIELSGPPASEKPVVKFIGFQEDGKGGGFGLYNVKRPDGKEDTWSTSTLIKKGIEIPETPPAPWEKKTPEVSPAEAVGPVSPKKELPPHVLVERRIRKKYKDILATEESEAPHDIYDGIQEGTVNPKDIDKYIESADNKTKATTDIQAAIADRIGDLIETHKYESFTEGRQVEKYIDSLLAAIEPHKIPPPGLRDPLPGATPKERRAGRLPDDRRIAEPPEPESVAKLRGRKKTVMPGDIGPGVRTLRGAIRGIGGINFLNLKGELKELPTAVKFLSKKPGVAIDLAVEQLVEDGWLDPGTTVDDFLELLRTDKNILKRDRVIRDIGEKDPDKLSPQEEQLKKEMEREAEEPPDGPYRQMRAEDLPEGAKLTIIEGKPRDGWDVYEVQQEPWETKLIDGETVTLQPGDRVEVLKKDLAPPATGGGPREAPSRAGPEPSKEQKFKESFKPKKSATMAELVKKAQERPADLQGTLDTIAATEKALEGAIKHGDDHAAETFRNHIKDLKKLRQKQGGKAEFVSREKPQKQGDIFTGKFKEEVDLGSLFKKTEKEFKGPGLADVGGYSKDIPAIIEMPELLEIYRDVMADRLPRIKKHIRGLAIGIFRPMSGNIEVEAHLFEDPLEALKVMAHEVGHWIDWLPNESMKRGNILGRIASLSGHTKHWLDDILGGPGQLTKADKKALWQEAKDLMAGDRWIDEVIKRELPITPDDILDIWNSGLPREALNQELLDYVMGLSTAEKKAIVVAAMRGQVPEEVKRFKQIIEEKTGKKKKVKVKASDKEVIDKYKNLILEELKKRNIYNRDEIMNELKTFTRIWKPFDPTIDPNHTKYRYSGVELYADAMSGLLTNAPLLRSVAPRFYNAWFTWLHRKPEFLKAYRGIQDRKGAGTVEITRKRMDNIFEMFKSGDEARIDAYMERRQGALVSAWDGIATYLFDKNHAALKIIRRLEKQSGLVGKHAQSTRWMLEELNYLASEANVYTHDAFRHVIDPLKDAGYDLKELGLVLFQRRIKGDRSKIGNPLGHSPETVEVDMKNIEQHIWGPEKTADIHRLAEALRTIREDFILSTVRESGLATPEFMEYMENTKDYATFSNVAWFKNKYGTGPGAGFYKQIGTLGGIENPVVSLILKDLSTLRAARINMVKRELLIDLHYSGLVTPAKMKWSKDVKPKGGRVPVDPPDPRQALFPVLVDGKAEFYYVSKKIADMFKRAPVEAHQTAIVWRYLSEPVKKILVQYNPIWMVRNVLRDFRQTGKNISEIRLRHYPKLAKYYKDVFPEVWAEIMKSERSDAIRYMLENKAIPAGRIWTAKDETFETELERMAEELDISLADSEKAVTAHGVVRRVANTADKLGQVSDIWGKVAGFRYMQDYSKRGTREIAHKTRSVVGTPDYRQIGSGQQLTNNLFIFSNVGKQGIRAAIESAVEDPGGYAWKTAATNIMPKIMIFALGAGVTAQIVKRITDQGADDVPTKQLKTLQRVVEGISEYDKAHYTIIPLGLTDKGKSVYLRIPEDYEGQFLGALFHKLMEGKIAGHDGIINLIKEQSPYQWHPLVMAASRLTAFYIQGQNPVDEYRGQYIMPEIVFEAGGPEAHKAVARSLWKELGGSLIYDPPWDGLQLAQPEWEKRLRKFPLNILGTFLKFSDRGITEKIDAELKAHRKQKAQISLDTKKAFIKLVNGDEITPEDAVAIIQKKQHQRRKIILGLIARKYGSAYMRRLTSARGKEEMIIIFNLMLKDVPK